MTSSPENDPNSWGTTLITVPHEVQSHPKPREDAEVQELASGEMAFKVRLATEDNHRSAATFLIKKRYSWRGYESAPLEENPNRVTLVASLADAHIGTISMGFDSPVGLNVDALYKDETDRSRALGGRLCEFIKLAIDGNLKSKRVLAALIHIAVVYAYLIRHVTDLFIEVNPRHVRYYERMFGFSQVGPERTNTRVNAPAVLMWISLDYFYEQIKKFGGQPHLAETEKSLYPFFFSAAEEAQIARRMATWADMVHV